LKKEKNLRVIYAISEDEDIILLTVFCEKSSNDYERYIKVAKKRWKFLNE
jgi:phage-related protein